MDANDKLKLAPELSSCSGFINRFYKLLPLYSTHEQTYDALEKEHAEIFGRKKYASFESFKKVKNKRLKN